MLLCVMTLPLVSSESLRFCMVRIAEIQGAYDGRNILVHCVYVSLMQR